jgi:hypothetical protein
MTQNRRLLAALYRHAEQLELAAGGLREALRTMLAECHDDRNEDTCTSSTDQLDATDAGDITPSGGSSSSRRQRANELIRRVRAKERPGTSPRTTGPRSSSGRSR